MSLLVISRTSFFSSSISNFSEAEAAPLTELDVVNALSGLILIPSSSQLPLICFAGSVPVMLCLS